MTKPDFIIIGAMKSATSTLHAQLAMQSGIFMTTPKEPNFFSDDGIYAQGWSWYEQLFEQAKPDDICGESSTHYTKLPDYPLTIERMVKRLKKPKLVYVMRHPVDRLVSHYIHQWSQNVIRCDINEAIERYPELIYYSRYGMQLSPYLKQFGNESILPIFSEMMKVSPQLQLEKVAKFIGYKAPVHWQDTLQSQNVSNARVRNFKGYKYLVDSQLMATIRRKIVPKIIRNRIKKSLTMQERPAITPHNLDRLIKIFDSDLLKLDDWLNMKIDCSNYHEIIKVYRG